MYFLQDYIKLRSIGEGANAKIWKVRHKSLGYVRAIKVLNATIEDEQDKAYQTFLKECSIMLKLGNGSNSHIVHVYQPRLIDNKAIVEMDYVDGCTLNEYIKEKKFINIDEVLRFYNEIRSALAYCHVDIYKFLMDPNEDNLQLDPNDARKVIVSPEQEKQLIQKYSVTHNDLHSNNIMRRNYDGSFVLLDFGLAIQDSRCIKSSAFRDGAPEYKSPEKWEGEKLTPASDIYGFGILLYEILAGQPPFVCDTQAYGQEKAIFKVYNDHLNTLPPDIYPLRKAAFERKYPGQTYQKDYPDELVNIIMRCLEKKPSRRYRNGKELPTFEYPQNANLAFTISIDKPENINTIQPTKTGFDYRQKPQSNTQIPFGGFM